MEKRHVLDTEITIHLLNSDRRPKAVDFAPGLPGRPQVPMDLTEAAKPVPFVLSTLRRGLCVSRHFFGRLHRFVLSTVMITPQTKTLTKIEQRSFEDSGSIDARTPLLLGSKPMHAGL